MIFEKVGDWTEKRLGEYLNKPVLGCPVCMTPWWGTLIYLVGHYAEIMVYHDNRPFTILFTVLTAAGFNSLFLVIGNQYSVQKKEKEVLTEKLEDSDKKS